MNVFLCVIRHIHRDDDKVEMVVLYVQVGLEIQKEALGIFAEEKIETFRSQQVLAGRMITVVVRRALPDNVC